jgi:hypothetical protein
MYCVAYVSDVKRCGLPATYPYDHMRGGPVCDHHRTCMPCSFSEGRLVPWHPPVRQEDWDESDTDESDTVEGEDG